MINVLRPEQFNANTDLASLYCMYVIMYVIMYVKLPVC